MNFWRENFHDYGTHANATYVYDIPIKQLYHHYPWMEPFYTEFEKSYDPVPVLRFMINNNYWVPIGSVVLYMLFCYFGQKVMKNYKPFKLETSLAAWNLFLSVFSTWGALRTVPHMIHRLMTVSFEDTVCEHVYTAYGGGANGFAVAMFILSKLPELVDTVFIVLRKKPLIFLHWYHHVTVLLFCWNAYVSEASNGLYFVSMNYTVHAVMYFYYFLMSIKSIPKWFPSWIITLMQITQMVIGTFIVGISWYYYAYGGSKYGPQKCHTPLSSLIPGGIIYMSYLYLFVEFAVKRFVFGIKEEAPKKAKKVE